MGRRNETSDDESGLGEVGNPTGGREGVDDAADAASANGPTDPDECEAERWDADDERRQQDCFAPPKDPCECYCLHCCRTFMSDQIWFQRIIGDPMGLEGFWMCPTPNCDGAGFTFDIFPTDPSHPANEGWSYDDGDDEEDEAEFDLQDGGESDGPWDPEETKYRELDEAFGDAEDADIEGEEWKYGLAPGERPPESDWMEAGRREREEEEKRYDQPDERPRILDWTNRDDRKPYPSPGHFPDDDIPF